MLKLNEIYNCDCLQGLKSLDEGSIDLTVTSPPYDDLRTYDNTCTWNFEIFKPIAKELYRVTRDGGVVVWVIGDAAKDGSETGSSFRQALYFQEIGFKLHDTMIYEKNSSTFPARLTSKRYSQIFEYMFVFVKGKKIRDDIKLIADKRNKWAGWTNWGEHSQYDADGNLNKTSNIKPIAEFSLRTNIWCYPVSFNDKTGHPAVFPEKLAEDHILSWSVEGDTVLDPFMGSGTTAKMAMLNGRNYIGFEINTDYYNVSKERIKKYVGKRNEDLSGVTVNNINLEDIEVESCAGIYNETLNVNVKEDKDLDKKAALWRELTAELEDYFNTKTYGILKNLKVNLSFASKANDARVQKVMQEKNLEPVLQETRPSIDYVETEKPSVITNLSCQNYEKIEEKTEPATIAPTEKLPTDVDVIIEKLSNEIEKVWKVIEKMNKRLERQEIKDIKLGPNTCINVAAPHPSFAELLADFPKISEKTSPAPKKATESFDELKDALCMPEPKRRGRPKGSKNKPKENANMNVQPDNSENV